MNCRPKCQYCEKPAPGNTDFPNCVCVGRPLFKCGANPTCPECQRAHEMLGKFFSQLLNSKQAVRADSIRAKLFAVLFDLVCDVRRDLRTANHRAYRECGQAIDLLKNVNVFDNDERGFQSAIRRALPLLPLSCEFSDEFAKRLHAWDTRRKCDAAMQSLAATLGTALVAKANEEALLKDLSVIVCEQKALNLLAKIGPQAPDSSLTHQIDALLTAATA